MMWPFEVFALIFSGLMLLVDIASGPHITPSPPMPTVINAPAVEQPADLDQAVR